jgi:UDPglucose--hexose-1-phosphate uridylyltransferase
LAEFFSEVRERMGEDHAAAARPHRRYNALRRSWVLVSPQRTARPWQGQTSKPAQAELLHYDPSCYLCPGNHRAGGVTNPQYTGVFAFDNDYPALLPTLEAEGVPASDGLLIAEPEAGRCRVVCFDPDHSLTLADMPVASIETVVAAWQDETRTLGALPEIHYVEIFENRGAMMGASNPHPHCQIWATGHVPDEPKLEGDAQREYFESHGRTLLADYLAQELKSGERLICENDEFAAVVPFWAVWPFETLILPKHPAGSFLDLNSAQASGLAAMLKRVTQTYNNVFQVSFPYTMGFHQRPVDGKPYPEWTFHAHFYPPLLRSAEIRKFMVGFEMLGMPQRDITAEGAAATLRKAGEGVR